VPTSVFSPLQPPAAVQAEAFVEVQLRAAAAFCCTVSGATSSTTLGGGGGDDGGAIAGAGGVGSLSAAPPPEQAESNTVTASAAALSQAAERCRTSEIDELVAGFKLSHVPKWACVGQDRMLPKNVSRISR